MLFHAPAYPGLRTAFASFRVVALEPPGQAADAPALPAAAAAAFLTFAELADQVHDVLVSLGILYVDIAFGVGIGANLLAKFASNHPTSVRTLLFVGPLATPPGWMEYYSEKLLCSVLYYFGMTGNFKNRFLERLFSQDTLVSNGPLVSYHLDALSHVNAVNLSHYLRVFTSRDATWCEGLKALKQRVLIFVGRSSEFYRDAFEFGKSFNPAVVETIEVEGCAHLVLEENPAAFKEPLSLFFQGLGIL
eukprot:CAMPEP_0177637648 /NCGR_PEP_ID=MMETSP0447-20121125/5079_1 /TAXON_ID=0 /ORGANISM="Stygamoeba regulata, Strain BSH-02190019" /LENGTH=247 /DNA_ID=CAMNT_0019139581 /DNA_START=46 /DNA_END=790 /DNA_ORIENTATION=+